MVYVSPGDNLTDVPSRVTSASVCMLSPRIWKEIENSWGPHSIYLIALDCKAPSCCSGLPFDIFLTLPNQRIRRSHCFLSDFPSFRQLLILSKFGFKSCFSALVSNPPSFSFYLCGIWSSPPVITGGLLSQACYWFCPPRYFGRPHRAFIYNFRQCIPFLAFTIII